MFREALAIRRKLPVSEPLNLATTLNNLAVTLTKKDNLGEAETLHREALVIRKKLLTRTHPELFTSINGLLDVLQKQRNHAAAEPLLLEANEIMQQNPQSSPDEKRAGIGRLWSFYTEWAVESPNTGKMAKASEWRKKLIEFDEASQQPKPASKQD